MCGTSVEGEQDGTRGLRSWLLRAASSRKSDKEKNRYVMRSLPSAKEKQNALIKAASSSLQKGLKWKPNLISMQDIVKQDSRPSSVNKKKNAVRTLSARRGRRVMLDLGGLLRGSNGNPGFGLRKIRAEDPTPEDKPYHSLSWRTSKLTKDGFGNVIVGEGNNIGNGGFYVSGRRKRHTNRFVL